MLYFGILDQMDPHHLRAFDRRRRTALLLPQTTLTLVFGEGNTSALTEFFVRHWGALLFVVCSLTVYAAFFPETRGPILTAAIVEKVIIVSLIFFGNSTPDEGLSAGFNTWFTFFGQFFDHGLDLVTKGVCWAGGSAN